MFSICVGLWVHKPAYFVACSVLRWPLKRDSHTCIHMYVYAHVYAYTDIFVYFVESVASEQSSEWPVTHRQKTKCRPFAFLDCFLVTLLCNGSRSFIVFNKYLRKIVYNHLCKYIYIYNWRNLWIPSVQVLCKRFNCVVWRGKASILIFTMPFGY